MFFLEVLNCVVCIFAGVVEGLNGLTALARKYKSYIDRRKAAETEKDPSASFPATDGSSGDCESNR